MTHSICCICLWIRLTVGEWDVQGIFMRHVRKGMFLSVFSAVFMTVGGAQAQTLPDALARAYVENPSLNAARAALRVTNEVVPQALSGYRPRVTGSADIGWQRSDGVYAGVNSGANSSPRGYGVQVDQTLWNGNRTGSAVSMAESQVLAARESLRATEQDILLQAVVAYMDVVRDESILKLRRGFTNLLSEQLKATRDRFSVGEVTRTDVAQAEARRSLANANISAAQAQLNASKAHYRRIIGADAGKLSSKIMLEKLVPKTQDIAIKAGLSDHPQVRGASYGVDVAQFAIKMAESALYPSVSMTGAAGRRNETQGYSRIDTASVVGRVIVPLYEAGESTSKVRQSKEQLGQRRIEVDAVRDQIRALIVANWGNLEAAKAQIVASNEQARANAIALQGVREEAKVGQRTTLDVLNAQQDMLDSQVFVVRTSRDRVVAAYALLGAMGRLTAEHLALKVQPHDPSLHYQQVRDRWTGVRTPDEE